MEFVELTLITNLTNLFPIKNDNYWLKIGKIGNYCQLKTACCLPYRNYSLKLIKLKQVVELALILSFFVIF